MKNGDIIEVRYLRHDEEPKVGETMTSLKDTHHGEYVRGLAVKKVKFRRAEQKTDD